MPNAPVLLPLDDALRRLWEAVPAPDRPAVRADRDDPAQDRSTMDGLAVRAADGVAPRTVLGTLFAGDDPSRFALGPGEAVRVMTGAGLPAGADAVVPVEDLAGTASHPVPVSPPRPGAFILPRGAQARGGETLLPEGRPWNAAVEGLCAQVGLASRPLRRVRVGIAATGDELVESPSPWQIRDANGPMLTALAHALGAEARPLPAVQDRPEAVAAFLDGLGDLQVVLTAGGVSLGERDLLPDLLAERGADVLFHRIRIRPGKPTLAARLDGRVLLCLPGNPVSAYVNARLFLPVVLARLEGRALPDLWRPGLLAARIENPSDRPLLHPCRRQGEHLHPLPSRGSADLVRLAHADACAWVPEGGADPGPVRWLDLP